MLDIEYKTYFGEEKFESYKKLLIENFCKKQHETIELEKKYLKQIPLQRLIYASQDADSYVELLKYNIQKHNTAISPKKIK